ncbi:MAG: hypothetical protein K8R18_04360 [Parvibaculum sp.]|uniref:hypothetical protein n=1 Tax=Parvibaculum sp. TaxID=2024848 RepID=UPI0025E9DBEF|nr:hypothetical protein [Parvibaculum sp.]MCE9648841.1 hypothetical protein [Parvibaculum sp.]
MKPGIFGTTLFAALFAATLAAHAASHAFSLEEFDYIGNKTLKIEGEVDAPDAPKWTAVFVLHGCDGITQWSRPVLEEHASFYKARGFATIVLDSWRPRGLRDMCALTSSEAL